MSWLFSGLIGVLTAVVGGFAAGVLGSACVRWYRISSFEGGSAYYALSFTFLGTVLGLIGGIVSSRFIPVTGNMFFLTGLGVATGGMVVLVSVVGFFCWLAADIAPTIDGRRLNLVVEVRGGKSFKWPVKPDECAPFICVYLPGGRHQPSNKIDFANAKQVDGRWIIPGIVRLDTSVSQKFFRAYFNKENDGLFALRLRSHPNRSDFEWSKWIDSGWNANEPEPPADEKLSLRYRVQTVSPPPPEPTVAEIETAEAAKEHAKFAAIAPDAPLTDWLPYTRYGAVEDRLKIAIGSMTARPNFVSELGELMLSSEQQVAVDALRVIANLPNPSPELVPAVVEAGREIIVRIRKVNSTTVEEDPSYLGAADVAVRFSAWMEAVRTLRAKVAGNFTPQLAEMLELSRVREESYVMQQDVRRVASYYMHEWAGLEPLTTDPKPR